MNNQIQQQQKHHHHNNSKQEKLVNFSFLLTQSLFNGVTISLQQNELPFDQPFQNLSHQREVGCTEVLHGDETRIPQGPHHLCKICKHTHTHCCLHCHTVKYEQSIKSEATLILLY